ncbi:hypothetical protein PDIG_18310 [Penicillium digitatum PHI26]|uniref:Uncharacterized protein n=2 Tax=Penicillium digitatum TaxID=36651 RepID=K9G4Q0_PEND2|nr:hypothetical protein PDIP_56140 [Penicillium digitatum Pd1]EKV11513.1 hypothetical protein PDIP_56140 [Penicillium digitatum Pd1]EKV16915.1 hypothetical protein PDIG_18310 [Penicillium digitatum PHI26]
MLKVAVCLHRTSTIFQIYARTLTQARHCLNLDESETLARSYHLFRNRRGREVLVATQEIDADNTRRSSVPKGVCLGFSRMKDILEDNFPNLALHTRGQSDKHQITAPDFPRQRN